MNVHGRRNRRTERGLVELQVLAVRRMARKASRSSRAGRPRGCTRRRASSPRTGPARRIDEKSWGEGISLGHAGALDYLVAFLRQRLSRAPARRRRVTASCTAASSTPNPCASMRRCSRRSRNTSRSRRCTSRTTWRPSGRCSSGCRSSRRSRASIPRSTGRQPPVAQAFALPEGDHAIAASSATASTGCRTNTSRRRPAGARRAAAAGKVVVLHLGNGSSMCAIAGGRSVASTMGFTAADGLPMGTRCGNLDPGVVLYLMDELEMDARAIEKLIYQQSGLLGVSGISSDMRTLEASNEPGREGGDRPLRLPDRPRAGLARRRARRARRDRVHGGHRREQPLACASASAATPRGSASSSMPTRTSAVPAASAPRRVACRHGSFRPTRS